MQYEIKIREYNSDKLKAFVDVVFDSQFVVTGIKLMMSTRGLFVAMPSQKGKNKEGAEEWKDICYPITKQFREELNNAIIAKYCDETGNTPF